MAEKGQHVIPSGNRWAVRRSGAARASGVFMTREEAIRRGREIAKNEGAELYVHDRSGRIESRASYRREPSAPKV